MMEWGAPAKGVVDAPLVCLRKVNDPGLFDDNLEKACPGCGELLIYSQQFKRKTSHIARMICTECADAQGLFRSAKGTPTV